VLRFAISILVVASTAFATVGASAQSSPGTPLTPLLTEAAPAPQPERYDVIAVDRAQFLQTTPERGQIATFSTYTEELLRVKWRQNDPIDVAIVKPTGIAKPPVVIFLYGYGTDPEKFLNPQFCATLASKGFAAVGFQTALTGPRYHDRPLKKWFVSELPESIGASVHDVQLMIDYLTSRGDLDTNRIGIFGQGSGGAIAILAAAADARITAIDLMNPWGDWPVWLAHSPVVPNEERAGYLSAAFLEKVKPLDPELWVNRLGDRPLRLQQTLFDPETPQDVRKKLQDALPKNGQLASYADQAAYMENVSHKGRMLDWMQDQLSAAHAGHADSSTATR
jgi:cephalosporin-C deacetylase-like acetyl esterase